MMDAIRRKGCGSSYVLPYRRESAFATPRTKTVVNLARGGAVRRRRWYDIARRVLVCVAVLGAVASFRRAAGAEDAPAPQWDVSLATQIGHPFGYVQVGENQYRGDRLSFHGDLGVDTYETVDVAGRYRFTPQDAVHLGLQMFFLDGSTTLPRDVFFNGTKLEAGTTLDTNTNFPDFFRITAMYERELLPFGDRGTVTGGLGVTWVGLNFRLNGTVAPDSPKNEPKEDFLTQELPVPLLGLRLEYPVTDRVQTVTALEGGYLPWVNSGRTEGGTVDLTQSQLDALAEVRYLVWGGLSVEGGAAFSYFVQHELSHEDNNYIQLSTLGAVVGARYVF